MATIKSYTSLEQSKKLAKILPLESADMYWDYDVQKHEYYPMVMDEQFDDTCIPCWSLSALLELMPEELPEDYFLTIWKEKNEFGCCYENCNGNSFHSFFGETAFDAAFEMVCWLKKNHKI